MFRKILIIAMFATAAGYCWASDMNPQVVTSEVFYREDRKVSEDTQVQNFQDTYVAETYVPAPQYVEVPAWPIAGSDADVMVSCDGVAGCVKKTDDNIQIVSKIGADLVVENNFNVGTDSAMGGSQFFMGREPGTGWSGGANMLHGTQVPMGFLDECHTQAEMPLMQREMLEDDGGEVLAVSRASRKRCMTNGGVNTNTVRTANGGTAVINNFNVPGVPVGVPVYDELPDGTIATTTVRGEIVVEQVDQSADAEAPIELQDQVRSWVVASGQTLRGVLQTWCDKEGWDLVWATPREYPIEASAVFKGRFVDVASALVRNFGRAAPVPYAKFYKGNRVLVISTTEE